MLFAEADESGENEGNQNSEISQGSLTVEPHKLCSFRARVKDETLEYTDSVRNCKGKEDVCTTEIRNGSTATRRKRRKIVNKCTVRRVVEGREQRVVSDERMREGMKTFAI